jgi:tetratricopeptide (TPR) repeat protein
MAATRKYAYNGGKYTKEMRLWLIPAICILAVITNAGDATLDGLRRARDQQNLSLLDRLIDQYQQTAQSNAASTAAQYRLALANSYAAEVAMELHDKRKAESYAEAGIKPAQRAVEQDDKNPEYHRLLGELCGQVIPANPILGTLKYGNCARDEIHKAIELDSRFALAYVTQGVGDYYLPESMGGGANLALREFDKAISLDSHLAEAYLWKGIVLRKLNRYMEARAALEQALKLDPDRLWAKQELEKIPIR